jgi:hypothetical protein
MKGVDLVTRKAYKQAIGNHLPSSAQTLLRRLEYEHDRSRQDFPGRQVARSRQQCRGVAVMTTSMKFTPRLR